MAAELSTQADRCAVVFDATGVGLGRYQRDAHLPIVLAQGCF